MFHPGNHAPNGVSFPVLQVNKSLTSIDLRSNQIGDKGAAALGQGLAVKPRSDRILRAFCVAVVAGIAVSLACSLYCRLTRFLAF